ncbi:MAG: DUF6249 domain-containing protein [Verrucomicrobiota bacterium]|nr:DUF6249 domain-containing protein [Verrucomicrobiota bacterium]
MKMKTALVTCFASIALALLAFGQDPTPSPAATSSAFTVTTSIAPTAVPSASPIASAGDDLESRIDKKVKKGLSITFGDDDKDKDKGRVRVHRSHDSDDDIGGLMAIPIVGIIFTTLFGAPVLVVAAIMFFSYLRSRSLHRTVRMMVEKGQPVPAALFAAPPVVRARSDMRRGVVLVMVGFGLMVFFGACSDWEGGAWAIGIIPFLIGAGYLLVWKLEGNKPNGFNKASTDNPPPLP